MSLKFKKTDNRNELSSQVSSNTTWIKISVRTNHCDSVGEVDGGERKALGLGKNLIRILIRKKGIVEGQYMLIIYRRSNEDDLPPYHLQNSLEYCRLRQDCKKIYNPQDSCGFSQTSINSWKESSRICTVNEENSSEWIIPCISCNKSSSCYFSAARWKTEFCSMKRLKIDQLKRCLSGKHIVTIGDSTIRGVLYYIIEKINSTLERWEKTHETTYFDNINDNKTIATFAYYPQFWKTSPPTFKAVLERNLPENGDIIILVGGVQWLTSKHLKILSELTRNKRTRVVVKTYNAAFHQPVDGVRQLQKIVSGPII